jgi:anhydro-N-acetylmuramic acid kinase
MVTDSYTVIGLMSGTSLDGLDIAYCQFAKAGDTWQFELLASDSIGYDGSWLKSLKNAVQLSDDELVELDFAYGSWLGTQTKDFIQKNNISVDLIASHGHTVFHQPEKGITLQIGSGQAIADFTGKKVICDFRKKDVSLGGQGAPLVPIGDEYLFDQYGACLNLGGIANISFKVDSRRVAFDIGIANMLLNHLANQLGKPYDESGLLARSGKIDQALLAVLNNLAYYQLSYPKSTGYEWFLSDILPGFKKSSVSIIDELATAVEHVAMQIGKVITDQINESGKILVTGGGAHNKFLMERLKHYTPQHLQITVPNSHLADFKEAIVFALMGVLRFRGEDNCLGSVTGASQNCSGGVIFNPVYIDK